MNNLQNHKPAPLWAVWRNPIIRRCWYARMRSRILFAHMAVVLTLAIFLFFTTFNAVGDRAGFGGEIAARAAFFPILVLQGLILLLMGTGAVTSMLVAEGEEGMLDFQRLTPLPPAWKILGYWLGAPVREYVLFALTLPFTAYAVLAGGLPVVAVLKVYVVLLTSTLLYHITGYVAGFTVKRRRFGTRMVQVAVVLLYLVLPQLASLGYVFFEHLTVRPVFREQLAHHLVGVVARAQPRNEQADVALYGLELPQVVFSLTIQWALIAVFYSIVRRKWLGAARHTLGKPAALAVLTGIVVLMLGNLLPLLEDGRLFPSRMLQGSRISSPSLLLLRTLVAGKSATEAGLLVAVFAALLTLLASFLLRQTAPSLHEQQRGWRRCRRLGQTRIPPAADEASAMPWAVAGAGVVAAALLWFGNAMSHSRWIEGKAYAGEMVPWLALTPVFAMLTLVAAAESSGKRGVFLLGLAGWVIPAMVLVVCASASDAAAVIGLYCGAVSPLTAPFCAMTPADAVWQVAAGHGHRAFLCGLVVNAGLFMFVLARWMRARRATRKVGTDGAQA